MNKKKIKQILLDARVLFSSAVVVIGFLVELISE